MKILKKIIIMLLIIISIDMLIFSNIVNAITLTKNSQIEVHIKKKLPTFLYKNEEEIETNYLCHFDDGYEMPVYCLDNESLEGFSNIINVILLGKITNMDVWKIIVNGYPYKNLKQLGCNNEEEAYTATQHAIYCYYDKNLLKEYTTKDKAGERTLQAIGTILSNAEKTQEIKNIDTIRIIQKTDKWERDEKDENYISKKYKIEAKDKVKKYKISLNQIEGSLPEGIKIVDKNNQEKEFFEDTEEFKIMIPVDKAKDIKKFEIDVEAQLYTKPMAEGVKGKKYINFVMLGEYEKVFGKMEEEYKNIILPVTGK